MHRILISGASGFIGKNLVDKLIDKNNDLMLVGRNLDMFKTNIIKKKILDLGDVNYDCQELINFNPDVFIHLAWEGIPNYSEEFSKKNYLNTLRIIKNIVEFTNCKKIISTGSCWEYNDGNIEGKCKENIEIKPKKPFSIYKKKILDEISIITKKKNIIFNWLRLFYVYGPGQKKESIIPSLIETIRNKKTLNINYPANKNDYIYVDDVIKFIKIFINQHVPSGIYNIGSGKGIEVKNLLKIIDKEVNGTNDLYKKYLSIIDENKRNQNFYACTKKIEKYFKNFKLVDIENGIRNVIKNT